MAESAEMTTAKIGATAVLKEYPKKAKPPQEPQEGTKHLNN